MVIDRILQKKLREDLFIQDRFRFNDSYVSYKIISKQGLIFEDEIDKFHYCSFLKNRGKRIFYQSWIIDNNRSFIFFAHGNAENSSTHPSFIYHCIKNGYNFISFDQIGYGDSDGIRGTIRSFQEYIENLNIVFEYFYNKFKENNPIFYFVGFSMGGLEILYYIIFYEMYSKNSMIDNIKKVFLFSPYLKNHNRLINNFFEYYFLLFNKCFSFTELLKTRVESQKAIFENGDDFYINLYRNLTDNKEFLIKRKKDIRIHRLNSNKWLSSMIKAQREIKRKIYYSRSVREKLKKMNLYFFISEKDFVVDNIIALKYSKILNLKDNTFLQKGFYHDFLDYEDQRIDSFYKNFFALLQNSKI